MEEFLFFTTIKNKFKNLKKRVMIINHLKYLNVCLKRIIFINLLQFASYYTK